MPRTLSLDVLDNLRVASPCSMAWEQLDQVGDAGDRIRHCGQCDLNVYNVANLSREETLELVAGHVASGERLCAMLYRRTDGTLLTRDCPVGLAAIRRRAMAVASRVAAAALLGASVVLAATARSAVSRHLSVKSVEPFQTSALWLQQTANRLAGRTTVTGGAIVANCDVSMGSIASPIVQRFPRSQAGDSLPPLPALPHNPDGSVSLFPTRDTR